MSGFVEGIDRSQRTLFPAMLDDYVAEDNPVRAVDAFVEGLDLDKLGFGRVEPLEKGRPSYHAATLLKIYIYGYLNRVPSSRLFSACAAPAAEAQSQAMKHPKKPTRRPPKSGGAFSHQAQKKRRSSCRDAP